MPRDLAFPRPSAERCPGCDVAFDGVRCGRCGLVLTGDDAALLWRINSELHQLSVHRRTVIERLHVTARVTPDLTPGRPPAPGPVTTAPAARPDPPPAPPGARPGPPPAPPGAPPGPPPAPPGAGSDARPTPRPARDFALAGWGPPSLATDLRPGGGPPPHLPPPPTAPAWPWPSGSLTLPNLLLGLGTALIVVAAIVFTAVRWSQLGSTVQGLVLLGMTAAAAWATGALRRHGLAATAEAVSVVTVALLPVDIHAVREAAQAFSWTEGPAGDPLIYWCLAIWAVAGLTWWFGRVTGTSAPRIIAAVAAQVPVPLYVIDRPVGGAGGLLLCLAQAAAAAVVIRRTPGAVAGARVSGVVGAAGTWLTVVPLAAALALDDGSSDRFAGAGVLLAAAAVAGLVAVLWAGDETVRPLASAAGTAVGLAAAGFALSTAVRGEAWWPAAAGVCAVVLASAVRAPRRWADPPAAVAGVLGALASLPVAAVLGEAVTVAGTSLDTAWEHGLATRVGTLSDLAIDPLAPGLVVAHLAVLGVAVVSLAGRIGRPATVRALLALAGAAVVAAPVVADLPVGAAVAVSLAAAYAPMAWLARPGGCAGAGVPVGALLGFSSLALLWAAATPTTTLVALGAVGVLAAWLAGTAVRDGIEPLALAAGAAAAVAVAAEAALATTAAGRAPEVAWLAAGLAAAATTLITGLVAGRLPPRSAMAGRVATMVEATGVAIHLTAVAAVAGGGALAELSVLVPATALVAGWFALRAVRDRAVTLALAAVPALAIAVCGEAGLVTAALGGTGTEAWLAVGLAAAAGSLAAAALDPTGSHTDLLIVVFGLDPTATRTPPPDPAVAGHGRADMLGLLAGLGEVAAAAIHLVALAGAASADGSGAASALLAVGAATAALHALRPGRRFAAAWATGEALTLVWLRLAVADVDVPEAYTAPVAVVFLVAALVAQREGLAGRYPSWSVHGPWLAMGLAPTVLVALDDPGLVRPLGGLVAGALVLVAGAITGRRAPVDIGAVTVAVLGLRQLAPVVADLPNWATLGSCGLLLLAVGATFEERRRNLDAVVDRYTSLR